MKKKGHRVGADPDSITVSPPHAHTTASRKASLEQVQEPALDHGLALHHKKSGVLKQWQSKGATKIKDWLHIQPQQFPHPSDPSSEHSLDPDQYGHQLQHHQQQQHTEQYHDHSMDRSVAAITLDPIQETDTILATQTGGVQEPDVLNTALLSPPVEVPTSSIEELFGAQSILNEHQASLVGQLSREDQAEDEAYNGSATHANPSIQALLSTATSSPSSESPSSPPTFPKSLRSRRPLYTYSPNYQSFQEYRSSHRRRQSDGGSSPSSSSSSSRKREGVVGSGRGPGRIPPRSSSLPRSFSYCPSSDAASSALLLLHDRSGIPNKNEVYMNIEPASAVTKICELQDDDDSGKVLIEPCLTLTLQQQQQEPITVVGVVLDDVMEDNVSEDETEKGDEEKVKELDLISELEEDVEECMHIVPDIILADGGLKQEDQHEDTPPSPPTVAMAEDLEQVVLPTLEAAEACIELKQIEDKLQVEMALASPEPLLASSEGNLPQLETSLVPFKQPLVHEEESTVRVEQAEESEAREVHAILQRRHIRRPKIPSRRCGLRTQLWSVARHRMCARAELKRRLQQDLIIPIAMHQVASSHSEGTAQEEQDSKKAQDMTLTLSELFKAIDDAIEEVSDASFDASSDDDMDQDSDEDINTSGKSSLEDTGAEEERNTVVSAKDGSEVPRIEEIHFDRRRSWSLQPSELEVAQESVQDMFCCEKTEPKLSQGHVVNTLEAMYPCSIANWRQQPRSVRLSAISFWSTQPHKREL
ncbi:hypothetical protein EDD11_007299 [Mortierella claussenii]|nr:hypothetical protein EDD11_007299 [Mortierella claussenii]